MMEATSTSLTAKLRQLQDALDSKLISETEFNRMRTDILESHSTPPTSSVTSSWNSNNTTNVEPNVLLISTTSPLTRSARRKQCCTGFLRVFALCLVGIAMILSIVAVAYPKVSEVWVSCPDSGTPSTCTMAGNEYCMDEHHHHHHHHDDDDMGNGNANANSTWCHCGQEYFKVGIHSVEWVNATNPLESNTLLWDAVQGDDDDDIDVNADNYRVFPMAHTIHNITVNSDLLVEFKHSLVTYRIFSFCILPFTILIFLDLWGLVRGNKCKSKCNSEAKQLRRAYRVPILLLVVFALGMTSFALFARGTLHRGSHNFGDRDAGVSLVNYYPETCTINPKLTYAGVAVSEHSMAMTAAVFLIFASLISCCCCKDRYEQLPTATIHHSIQNTYSTAAPVKYSSATSNSNEPVPPPYATPGKGLC